MKDSTFSPDLMAKIQQGVRAMHQIRVPDPEGRADAIDEACRSQDWERFVFLHDPGEWLDAFEQRACAMDDGTFWKVLLRIYCRLDTVARYYERFGRLFASRPVEAAVRITPTGLRVLCTLPDPIKIYRGYAGPYAKGFSWSLSLRIAKFFAYRAQERCSDPRIRPQVLSGLAQKKDVITLALAGPEAEVIIHPTCVTRKRRRSLGPLRGSLEDLIA